LDSKDPKSSSINLSANSTNFEHRHSQLLSTLLVIDSSFILSSSSSNVLDVAASLHLDAASSSSS